MVGRGLYRPGERLPSIRELSRKLHVGINTVAQAYQLLEDAGTVEARPQSGHFVPCHAYRCPEKPVRSPGNDLKPNLVTIGDGHLQIVRDIADERLVPLGRGAPSVDILPADKLNRMLAAQARRAAAACVSYAPSNGLARLRAQIARRSLDYGCSLEAENIVVTSGCVEAVHLALLATCHPGDTIVVESPVYYTFLSSIQWLGLKVLEVPATAQDGLSLDVLSYVLQQRKVQACLVISNYNNPLGGVMPDAKKRELVRLLAKHEIPLIEDDVYGDLGFAGVRPSVFKAYDEDELVLLCSSFSKTLAPGYRVGWIAPGRFRQRVDGLKRLFNLATATPTQLAISEFLCEGGYDRHLRATRRVLAQRAGEMCDSVLRHFPPGTRITSPAGGYFLWVEMPEDVDAYQLHRAAIGEGISIAPGMLFTLGPKLGHCLRLNCSFPFERCEKAIATLGHLAGGLAGGSRERMGDARSVAGSTAARAQLRRS